MDELISVIVPIYNTGKYLVECVESLRKQTYSNIEIILVDDGSTDASIEICDEFAEKDSRVKVFHKKNEGVAVARNFGIQQSNGQYVVIVDSDDVAVDRMIEVLYTKIKENDADIAVGNYYIYDESDVLFLYYRSRLLCRRVIFTRINRQTVRSMAMEQYRLHVNYF